MLISSSTRVLTQKAKHHAMLKTTSWRYLSGSSTPKLIKRGRYVELSVACVIAGITVNEYLKFRCQNTVKLDSIESAPRKISTLQLSKHCLPEDLWVRIGDAIYDLTDFISWHPGGKDIIMQFAGKSATDAFMKQHSKRFLEMLPPEAYIGKVDLTQQELDHERIERKNLSTKKYELENKVVVENKNEEEASINASVFEKPPLELMFNVNDFEAVAKKILPSDIYMYFATGSDDEATLRECHLAYSRIFFKPRILRDTNDVDTSATLIGTKASLPLYITAFAGQSYLDEDADMALAKVAKKKGIKFMYSRLGAYPVKEMSTFFGNTPFWCQVCVHYGDPKLKSAIEELNRYDNIEGIFITTDAAAGGNREKDFKTRAQEASRPELAKFASPVKPYPSITWEDIVEVRKLTNKAIILKGVQSAEDVLLAAEKGLDGVVISNHGGRQLDYSQPPLETLAEAMPLLRKQAYYNKEKFQVFIDGGVRRGSDILKAVALGASGVGMGKGFAFAVASYGEKGAEKLYDQLNLEVIRDMKLLGVSNTMMLNQGYLNMKGFYNRVGNYDDSYFKNYEALPLPFPGR
ncbi:uncharacterized protein PRCAT00003955001 [Priceomyces carsonii]|uniref:uncharacterized protein n=1 Tax=Priceomyces carsonii TaxID=28549 RepID=UPI002ED84D52|nr:unnamed protein product [Priceomyces carsonii]